MLNGLFCVVGIVLGTVLYRRRSQRYPPGPPGLPLVGNLFQVPLKRIWIRLDSWKKIYGPILYFNLAGQPIIVLNTKKVAVDLLERRATNYSSRPRLIVVGEYLNGGWNMALTEYGDIWRRMRRSSEYALGLKTSSQYQPAQSDEAVLLAYDLIHSTDQWENHIFRAVVSSITSLVYDLPPLTSFEDPTIKFLLDLVRRMDVALYPGSFAVEFLPVLDWLPPWLAKWKREAIRDHQRYNSKFEQMFSSAKDASGRKNNLASGICATVLKPGARHNLSDHELAWLAATLFTAGYETSSNTLTWSMYFMILFPEIQAKAQEQLDQVVGKSRLPTFADAKHLPYIWAIIKEMLRWRPPLPIGIPHATVADDYYEGYFIPKNSIVIPNIWSINRDPEGYDDRIEDFYPERYLDCDGNLKDALDEGHFAFGFGHRSCVGRHVANNTLF
ncbi:cytochrome P450, partial [Dendrothele bispora CBS 962.96]